MQMGVVKLPTLCDYWSKDIVLGGHPLGANVMPRYRFESLLSNLHLADNEKAKKKRIGYTKFQSF